MKDNAVQNKPVYWVENNRFTPIHSIGEPYHTVCGLPLPKRFGSGTQVDYLPGWVSSNRCPRCWKKKIRSKRKE